MPSKRLRRRQMSVSPSQRPSHSHDQSSVARVSVRAIGHKQVLMLYVRAGGRCEFRGCNKYLLKHSVTQAIDNFGEIGHIVAFSKKGPRGGFEARPTEIHAISNLMLLCDECHKLIDRQWRDYPVTLLREFKQQHEENIYHATGIKRSQKTAIVRLEAPINGSQAAIPLAQIHKAILPRHPLERPTCQIELNQQALISGEPEFMSAASKTIEARVKEFMTPELSGERIEHISIFALAPIPLLVLLGHRLGNTIPADVYQHHHNSDDWTWQNSRHPVTFEHKLIRSGTNATCVALLISTSGTIEIPSLPMEIDQRFYIYQISPLGKRPSTNCLRSREEFENFKRIYEEFLRDLHRAHPLLETVHLFPAVPPPIAVVCGRELMPKIDPALWVYDFDKKQGGFKFSLEVNPNDNR